MRRCLLCTAIALAWAMCSCHDSHGNGGGTTNPDGEVDDHSSALLAEGRDHFRFNTFGDEDFWGGTLRLHEAVRTLPPRAALENGLKVDAERLSGRQTQDLRSGRFSLDDADNTIALLSQDAIVGVKGIFDSQDQLVSIGITCALCHSTVDDSETSGVGRRLDG